MSVPSYAFLLFGTLVALMINISMAPEWRRAVLFVANVAFILSFTHIPAQLAPFVIFLAFGFAGAKLLEVYKPRTFFVLVVLALVCSFCYLKRYVFVPQSLFLPYTYFAVGMSYVFFRILHVNIDAFQNALPSRIRVLSYLNYTLNFTALVSGPIQFYRDYLRTESESPLRLDRGVVAIALGRIITGFFKVSISPLLLYAHQQCILALGTHADFAYRIVVFSLIMTIFPVYLYFNFSGYTDFVIGIARFLRLDLPENFDKPFSSEGFIEFWARWHMTLSNWIRTYVYSPLLLVLMRRFSSTRLQPLLAVVVYFIAFFLVGVWHGQTSMFVVLGVLLGLGVSINKLYQIYMTRKFGRLKYRLLCENPVYSALSRGLTFEWFAFSSLWFWSTWMQLAHFISLLGAAGFIGSILSILFVAALLLGGAKVLGGRLRLLAIATEPLISSPYLVMAWYTVLTVTTVSLTIVLNAPAPRIVYKGF